MTNLQTIILKRLIHDENYCRKAIPHIKTEYFEGEYRAVYELILNFIGKYNRLPNKAVLEVEVDNSSLVQEETRLRALKLISSIDVADTSEIDWLLSSTEKWCKDRAIHLAIMESIQIINGDIKDKAEGAIPDLLSKALSVTFDTNVGHDYIESAKERYEFYHKQEDRIEFAIDVLNKITNGGLPRKTLSVLMAGTGVGKSLTMCDLAASNLSMGRNVLYITMEMAEERIAERIDANLLDVDISEIINLTEDSFLGKVNKLKSKTAGKLIVKEYPTAAAHVGHFRALLTELKLKKNFVPDIIYIDYLNICASSRVSMSSNMGSYGVIKSIAEELRGLAVEQNVPIVSATQSVRGAQLSSDVEITDVSESFGLAHTVDLLLSLMSTEDLEKSNQLMFKQLKNRYNDLGKMKRFLVGIDRSKMRLYDIDDPMANLSNASTESKVAVTPFAASQPERKKFTDFKV